MPLSTPGRKAVFIVASLILTLLLATLSTAEYLASYFSARGDFSGLRLATALAPGNANYQDLLGHYFFFVEQSPQLAMSAYQRSARLDPYASRYWLDQAAVYKLLDERDAESRAIEQALAVEPTNPGIAWEAANLFRTQQRDSDALRQLGRVMEADPGRASDALDLAWEINPSTDSLLRETIPSQPLLYWEFLDSLTSKRRDADAFLVWTRLVQMRQPLERRRVFGYVDQLLNRQDISHAQLVWQQASPLCDLAHYQPGADNLVVNGDFSFDVLNAGFDWRYEMRPEVTLSLDPSQTHGAERSLLITFSGQAVPDAGVRQLIPVLPNADYGFSAYSKTQDMEGAGGPRFVLQDVFDGQVYFSGNPLTEPGFWKATSGSFHTGATSRLLALRIQRFPQNLPIRGKLWIATVSLTPALSRQPL